MEQLKPKLLALEDSLKQTEIQQELEVISPIHAEALDSGKDEVQRHSELEKDMMTALSEKGETSCSRQRGKHKRRKKQKAVSGHLCQHGSVNCCVLSCVIVCVSPNLCFLSFNLGSLCVLEQRFIEI